MTDARSAGADPGARGDRVDSGRDPDPGGGPGDSARDPDSGRGRGESARHADLGGGPGHPARHPVLAYFRANPQVFVLLVVCLVLGLGTFIAVLVSLVTAGSDQTTGEPSGTIFAAHAMLRAARWLVP